MHLNSLGPGVVHNLLDLIRGVDLLLAVGPVTCKPRKGGEEQGKALERRDINMKFKKSWGWIKYILTVGNRNLKKFPLALTNIYDYYCL